MTVRSNERNENDRGIKWQTNERVESGTQTQQRAQSHVNWVPYVISLEFDFNPKIGAQFIAYIAHHVYI